MAAVAATLSEFSNPGAPLTTLLVRLVPEGGTYGLDLSSTHMERDPLVEFWDPNHPHTDLGAGVFGQFINRYTLSTLSAIPDGQGIDLEGGVPAWTLSATGLANAMNALSHAATHIAAAQEFQDLDPAKMDDIVSDLVHEAADEAGIAEGPERDAWRARALDGYASTPKTAGAVLARLAIPAHRIAPLLRAMRA